MHDFGAKLFSSLPVGSDSVPAKGIVLSDASDAYARFGNGDCI